MYPFIRIYIFLQEAAGSQIYPESRVHGANMRPIWGRQDPGGPHVGPMNLVSNSSVP